MPPLMSRNRLILMCGGGKGNRRSMSVNFSQFIRRLPPWRLGYDYCAKRLKVYRLGIIPKLSSERIQTNHRHPIAS